MGPMSEIEFNYEDVRSVIVAGLGSGDVTINPADEGDSSISGRLTGSPAVLERTAIAQSHDSLRIEFPRNQFGQDSEIEVELLMPPGIDLALTSGSAQVVAQVPLGATKINTG